MKTLTSEPPQSFIQQMFDELSCQYDLFNRLTSLGLDGIWRKQALNGIGPGMRVLDLGCGSGDLTLGASRRFRGSGEVVGLDFSQKMLKKAQQKIFRAGPLPAAVRVRFEHRRAEEIPFEREPYDVVVSGFVLRNIYENIDAILGGVYESLKPGGQVSLLDFTEPQNGFVKKMWQVYMASVATLFGKLIFGKKFPAGYMADSAKRFLKAPEFAAKMQRAGFRQLTVKKMMLGIIVLYRAEKPSVAARHDNRDDQ